MVFAAGFSHQSIRAARTRSLTVFAFLALSACFVRLAYLQIVRGAALARASESNHTQILVERAPRGRILDRDGRVMADDQPVFVALFSPLGLDPMVFEPLAKRLSAILNIQGPELQKRLFAAVRAKSMVRISDRLNRAQAFQVLQDRIHLPGISLTIEEQRYYPKKELASHVLGYVGEITDDELDQFAEQGYHGGDWIGKSGLERLYDPSLHGQDGGFLIEVDARGRQVRVIRHVLPQAGKDLMLTLDEKVQELAEKELKDTGHPGAAVVMNPQTGELIALASSPGFDPNLFMPLGDSEERKDLLSDPDLPLYNRTIQALYPPGSTFKIITSLSALESGSFDPDKKIYCNGSYTLGKERRVFHCWKPHGHGSVSFITALAQSCDVYFYQVGQQTGPAAIEEMAKRFGLGAPTGVDLPHEKKWPLPLAWKQSRTRPSERYWHGGETLNYAIGQGALQVTPLQMANVVSMVANGGSLWQPYLVSESQRFGQFVEHLGGPRMVNHIALSEKSLSLVREGLVEVVRHGTGVAAQIQGIDVAGKTGTAQVSKGKDHAWFVAYAPAEKPEVACSVVVEHGGHGASVAAPIAHDLLAMVLKHEEAGHIERRPSAEVEGD
jgi:penicillin-binding protein 2